MPSTDKFWPYLTSESFLRRAFHLVQRDALRDFEDPLVDRQVFAFGRDATINEIIAALQAERYLPEPVVRVQVPKSTYSQRPGAILPYRDRILLQAIVMCLAPQLDAQLSRGVWSWRVKKGLRGKDPEAIGRRGIFRETDITEFPFLKRETVTRYIEPFDPWYALWPMFDRISRSTLRDPRFGYMVVSDISAYFENIELNLLHGLLLRYVPEAPETVNLLMRHLKVWSGFAFDGSQILRGIPQGNSVSSFLGNFFLKPVDDFFAREFDPGELRYYRYVDDIRIVTTSLDLARTATLALEHQIRSLKLNLQTAKTMVLTSAEAMKRVTDNRLDDLDACRRLLGNRASKNAALSMLQLIANDRGDSKGAVPIRRSRPPLSGLNLRVLRRWANYHRALGSPVALRRMAKEAICNPNYAVTREIHKIAVSFPGVKSIPTLLWEAIVTDQVAFPYQEAELIRGLKIFRHVPAKAFRYSIYAAENHKADSYLRLQAVLLLCRSPRFWKRAQRIVESCLNSADSRVITAGVFAASLDHPNQVRGHVQTIGRHASPYATRLIQYIRELRSGTEKETRRKLLAYVFQANQFESRLYEFYPFLRFIATGSKPARRDMSRVISQFRHGAKYSRVLTRDLDFLTK